MNRSDTTRPRRRRLPALLTLGCLCCCVPLSAQTGPTGIQDYFVLGYEQHVWDMMSKVEAGQGGGPFADAMNSLVTAVSSADNQVILYDHWEDGLEADINNPVQASTLVIGDGNPANGDACDFNNDPCGVDQLSVGDFVNFASNQGVLAGCTVASASPLVFTELCSSVPLNPRCAIPGACTPAEVRFDGGDFLRTSGGPLSLVHSQDPLTQFIGGSTEVISKQAVQAARSYSVPIGEDLYGAFGCPNCVMEPFNYVDLNLVAFDDNTQVFVDSPGAGTASFTLNRGQHWSSLGFVDGSPFDPALFLTINSGTKVSTTAPIAGMMFTGGDGQWATRHYTLLPDLLHSTDYVITAPGDDPAVTGGTPDRPANIYIFNPDPLNANTVTVTDSVGSTMVNVPANSVVDYFTATGRFVPNGSTVRMTSNRNFWGISGYDYNTNVSDWGHSWLATAFLTETYTISFAPGTLNPPVDMVNLSAVFVAATADNTQVNVDFDNDGVFDAVDLDGDGATDAAPLPGNTYLVNALESLRIFDPNDFDNTGTRVIANKPVAVAYGQDTDLTDFGDTALDTGFTVYPTDQRFLEPVLVLEKSVSPVVLSTGGGVATYTLSIQTFSISPITNLLAWDLLPPGVAGADYVPGSTLVTYPDLSQDTADPVASIDPGTGRDRLDWTLSPDSMNQFQTLTIRYSVNIPAAPGGTPRVLVNEGHAQGNLGGSIFSPFDTAQVVQSDLFLDKFVADDGSPEPGEVLTYTLEVTNNGLAAETNTIITDPIPVSTTFLTGSITSSGPFTGAYSPAQNAVVWTAANFPVSGPHTLTFQVVINPGVPAGTVIPNSATYESDQTPLFPSNEVETVVVGPSLVVSKSGPGILHPNEVGSFEIVVENIGAGAANNVRIVDLFPSNATYVTESMEWRLNFNPFVPITDAADADEGTEFVDRLELLVPLLGPGQDLTFRFDVQVDPGTAGLFVNNQATVTSDEVLPTDTNLVQVPIIGGADITGHVFLDLDGDGVQDPGEPDLASIDVVVTDSAGGSQVVTTDANGDYIATVDLACYEDAFTSVGYNGSGGALDWSTAGYEWMEFGVAADQDPTTPELLVDLDPLGMFGNSLSIVGGPAASARGFTRQVDLSVAAGFTQGSAALAFNYRRASLEAADVVTVDIDYDNDGVFNDVLVSFPGTGTDATWQSASIPLDPGQLPDDPVVFRFFAVNHNFSNDVFWVDNVRICNTQATTDVDESDPDFPPGAVLTTANDPQNVNVVPGAAVATTPVGYEPPPLTFVKSSDAPGGELVPGESVIYTLQVTNNSGVVQTGIDINDPLPAGALAVPGSTTVDVTSPLQSGPGNDPPGLVVPADGFTIDDGATMTVTFQVLVDPGIAPAITTIDNTATLDTDLQGPFVDTVSDDVIRLSVVVEPNNAGFAVPGGSVTYTHEVVNTGDTADSYDLTLPSELGYVVQLIDPTTGAVIATDSDGNGVWDGAVTVNTGTLNPGESAEYRVRVQVPGGAAIGTEETTTLVATSARAPALVEAFATDETTVVDNLDTGPVQLVPDHSGVIVPGGFIVYTHSLTNNTGVSDTFDLTAFSSQPGWTATIYNDSNGDGLYNPGIDVAIANSRLLADGELQTLFVVVDAPPGAVPGDTDVATLTAISRNDPSLFDGATDTTTVIPASTHDLSGGGTLLVDPGDTPAFPGTIKNLGTSADRFDLTVSPSPFLGLDGLLHPTQLWIDTNDDGVPDLQIAEDSDGDGVWDSIAPGFDVDMDGAPDVAVAADDELAYELRRPVDLLQPAYRDPVTLTATSHSTGEVDSVTATNLLAAVTHALVSEFSVWRTGGDVVLEGQTSLEAGTVGFFVERLDRTTGRVERLDRQPIAAPISFGQGSRYRFLDRGVEPGADVAYLLVERERDGAERLYGPFDGSAHEGRPLRDGDAQLLSEGWSAEPRAGRSRSAARSADRVKKRPGGAAQTSGASGRLRVLTESAGLHFLAVADLAAAFGVATSQVDAWIAAGSLRLSLAAAEESGGGVGPLPGQIFADSFESGDSCLWSLSLPACTPGSGGPALSLVAWMPAADGSGIYFVSEAVDSIYTTRNVYWLEPVAGLVMASSSGGSAAAVAGQQFVEVVHFEEEQFPLTSVIEDPESDFWYWQFFLGGSAGQGVRSFTLPAPGAVPGTAATLHIHLQAETDDPTVGPDHRVEVRVNGSLVGDLSWDGPVAHEADLVVPAGVLIDGDNTVEVTALLQGGVSFDVLYLDSFDLTYARYYDSDGIVLDAPRRAAAILTMSRFTGSDIAVFDLSDVERPRHLVETTIEPADGLYRVSFEATGDRYLATRFSAASVPVLEVDLASDLRATSNQAEYLVIAGGGLEAAAADLANYRASSLASMVVRLQDIYDEFSGGVADPFAIRDFLQHAHSEWATSPRFVVLAGDGSFDYRDVLGSGENVVPALLSPTPDGLFPADHRFVDFDGGDGVPELAIGRIPVRTNTELAAYVTKLQAYEATAAAWKQQITWVADNVDEGGEFTEDTETLIPLAPSGFGAERLYVDDLGAPATRSQLLAAIDDGALFVNYLGHGGPDRLASEGLLVAGDVAAMANGERTPILLALTCGAGRFDLPGFDTLSESLVRHGAGGVVALWGPSGLSFNAEARLLGERFLSTAFDGMGSSALGELIRQALLEYTASSEPDAYLPFVFNLQGDPAILVSP